MPEIFTQEWAEAWCRAINENPDYREAARTWEGEVALVLSADAGAGVAEDRVVIADLWHGECRGARAAGTSDLEPVPFVIRAGLAVWRDVLEGRTDPIVGLMGGKLKLEKGSLFKLLPYARAAKEMVASAQAVDTQFPG